MAHIALDVRFIDSGTGTYALGLLDQLQEIDTANAYSVLVHPEAEHYWTPRQPNFTVRTVPYRAYSVGEQIGFWRYLTKLDADLVHFCMPQQPLLYRGKTITTIMDLTLLDEPDSLKNPVVHRIKQALGRVVFRRAGRKSDQLTAISQTTADEFVAFAGVDPRRIETIHLSGETPSRGGVADEAPPGEMQPYDDLPFTRFLMYVGQQADYKNVLALCEAHQMLLDADPDLGLVLVGRLNQAAQRNKDICAERGYRNILFTGLLPDVQRDWLYGRATVYVFPSLREGFGLPPLEAMAHGLPVISSDASCMPEILGDAPVYVSARDVPAMASTIAATLADPDLLERMRAAGLAQAATYSWRRMAEETHALYLQVLAR